MSEKLGFYNLIDPAKRIETLDALIAENTEIVIKINELHCRTKILAKRSETEFLISKISPAKFKNERVMGSFEFKRNKYFFKTSLTSNTDGMTIVIPTEIFQLQRRNNFRVAVPIGVKYVAEIQTIKGKKVKEKIEIRDVSLGGCQIVFKKTAYTVSTNDELQLKIQMLDIDKDLIVCAAKHVLPLQNNTKVQVGVSFTDPDADFLTDLQSLLIHLDRIHRGKKYD